MKSRGARMIWHFFNFSRWLRLAFSYGKALPRRAKVKRRKRIPCRPRFDVLEERALLSAAQPLHFLGSDLLAKPSVAQILGDFRPDSIRAHSNNVLPQGSGGPTGFSPNQVRHAYGFDKIVFTGGIVGDGSGTTVAIVDAYDDPNIANDLHQFDVRFGLQDPLFAKVNEFGGTAYPAANSGWISEIALDVEWAHAIAPGAKILLVEANTNSYADLMTAVDYAALQPGVSVVSMSWGGGEFSYETSLDNHFVTPSGHNGVTFVVSSGDQGAPASYPSSSPNVLTVGGTHLSLDSQNNILSESAWSGSGGGISQYEAQPAFQNGQIPQSATMRTSPDVAYDADPNSGFPVYDSYNNGSQTPWSQWGGTSDAAPQWAALIAIANQGRASAGLGSLDGASQTLPMIYNMPSTDFHDITSGISTGTPNYAAAAGYDLTTGRGSPYADRVVADLQGGGSSVPQSPGPGPVQENFVVHADNAVYGQKFDANGNPFRSPYLVAFGSLESISVTRDGGGNLILFGIDPYLNHVWELKFDGNGNPTSSYYTPVWTGGAVESLVVGHDGHNNLELFAVDPFIHHVWSMKFDANSNPIGGFQLVSPGGVATSLTVGHDGNGNPLLFTVDPYFAQVQELRFSANGDPLGDFYRPAAPFAVESIGLGYDGSGNPELFAVDPYFGHLFYLNFNASGLAMNSIFLQAGTGSALAIAVGQDGNGHPSVFVLAPNYQVGLQKFDAAGNPVGDFQPAGPSVVSVASIQVCPSGNGLPILFGIGLGDNQVYEETFDANGTLQRTFFQVVHGTVLDLAI
ncbi:MAG: hypothetical protein ACJ8FY_21370 [Gemmataceae bacterium]